MKVKELKIILYAACKKGYEGWVPRFCDDLADDYSVNYVFVDDEGDICLKSTDMEGEGYYEFTTDSLLEQLKNYDPSSYVYFLEEDEDGDTYYCDISDNWYTDWDDDGEELLYIDCFGMED